ncbi:palmitoyltransferase ZDHHC6-like [Mya arenaria]|uniref:palmitoyltransferase ZDHHC6-like n=1 Tax=Mya arenaria TaxID=6604 RepID=UPI0022E4B014|nr:palmitoyltransferase ZDHHC6-like [Mya arenaria]
MFLRQLFHWGPIVALSIIFFISYATIQCNLMYWPLHAHGGLINMAVFLTWNVLTLYNYFLAAYKGPGFAPLNWRPKKKDHCKRLQYCELCDGYKPPRSHHCRKCDRCVMKMDHHCPWINTCCGHFNHANFCYFLFFAPIGCIHAITILVPSVYKALNFTWYLRYGDQHNLVYLGIGGFLVSMFAIGLAIGVIIAVWLLFFIQIKSVLKNETGIESWIIEKAVEREREDDEAEFVYPYHLGWRANLTQVFTWSGWPKSDGYTWDVVQGCNQFTFTEEQLQQKAIKRDRTVEFTIVESYSGAICPLSKGCGMCFGIPCTDEPRIPLQIGDTIKVTRWKKKWLYGTKALSLEQKAAQKRRERGWFPRRCAREIVCEANGHTPECKTDHPKSQ